MSSPVPYELLALQVSWRVERFGDRIVQRPAPAADGSEADADFGPVDLRFDRRTGWHGTLDPWTIHIRGLTLELRATDTGQVGLFPEHLQLWPWLVDRIAEHDTPAVLNLFAYTGATTLALAARGAAVTHVDASRPTVSWARHNAQLSGLHDRPIRWIVDDVPTFVQREIRRGRRYTGVVVDPPTYGHGRGAAVWQIERDLAPLLGDLARLTGSGPRFALLTAHTPGFGPERLGELVTDAFGLEATVGALKLVDRQGAVLELGAWAAATTTPSDP